MTDGGERVTLPWGKISDIGLAALDFHQGDEVWHQHSFHEMVLVRRGSGIHVTEEYRSRICRGDIFLVTPGCRHTYDDVKDLLITNILFVPQQVGLPMYDLQEAQGYCAFFEAHPKISGDRHERYILSLNESQLAEAEALVTDIMAEQQLLRPGSEFYRKSAFLRLVALISRAVMCNRSREIAELAQIGGILHYLDRNYHRPVTVAELSKVGNKSPATINRLFRKALQDSPMGYLLRLRLEKAAQLLRSDPQLPVGIIAGNCGFQDSNYFSKMFRRRFNVSPREYRQGGCFIN